ncbi:MAG: L-histidine N(alpha)-methyltransferase [Rhodothalassiaceae bacterium]
MNDVKTAPSVRFIDLKPPEDALLPLVLSGLAGTPKALPAKLFYDRTGSELFERICEQPEYYPTRTEMGILRRIAGEVSDLAGSDVQLVEFGAGALEKVGILLNAMHRPAGFVALDISGEHLLQAAQACAAQFPDLEVIAIAADYSQPFTIPDPSTGAPARRLGFFPGSTIGNMLPEEARAFLENAGALLGPGGLMLLGADLVKDPAVLEAAYNDAAGVTAAFNRNMLVHLNQALGCDFDPTAFDHHAFFNAERARIEMHLVSRCDQTVLVDTHPISFGAGESIHTENSHKYTLERVADLGRSAGFQTRAQWTDPDHLFSVTLLQRG